jgi:hypothetical protein
MKGKKEMKNINRLLVVAIVAVLAIPGFVFAGVAEACCGVTVSNLVVADTPDPLCEGATINFSGTYDAVTQWDPPAPYDTGWALRIFDSGAIQVFYQEWVLAVAQPDPGAGTQWSFTYDWLVPLAGDYTYEVIAWSETEWGREETSIVGGDFTAEALGLCTNCLIEKEIRDRWDAECPACTAAPNHGAYVGCRADIQNEYLMSGLITPEESSCLMNPEAKSDCGKK